MIHPHLAIVLFAHLWWNINKKLEKNFLKIQRKAIRTISKSNYNTPTALEILPIDELLIHSQGLLVHSIFHNYCPPSLRNTWGMATTYIMLTTSIYPWQELSKYKN